MLFALIPELINVTVLFQTHLQNLALLGGISMITARSLQSLINSLTQLLALTRLATTQLAPMTYTIVIKVPICPALIQEKQK
jgi:hypothetical protein